MALHRLLQIILLLLPLSILSCPDRCGDDIFISYPFGIGEGCYFDNSFQIICDDSSGPPRAFLSNSNLNVSDASSNTLEVNISLNSIKTSIAKGFNLSGKRFLYSTENILAAIGCENYTMINHIYSNISNNFTGCMAISTCDPSRNRGCFDFLCTVPPDLKFDEASLSINLKGCTSTFITGCNLGDYIEKKGAFVKQKDYDQPVPIELEWGKYKGECVEPYNSGNTTCNKDNKCMIQLSSEYYCLCQGIRSDSYRGCKGSLICNTMNGNNCSGCPYGYNSQYDPELGTQCSTSRSCSAGLGTLFLAIGSFWMYKFVKRRKAIELKEKFFKRNGGLLWQQHLSSNESNIERTKLFTSKELKNATDNYNANRILGEGGQGTVFKGMLAEGKIVAIKKFKMMDESRAEEFINEVLILSQINHRNVVQLLGCCLETEVPLLVYEFIPNGTLFQHIHDSVEDFPITWELRLRIAIEVAGALSYLHSAASIPIYHRDIKSTNILLNNKYQAKVSDFGASRSITIEQTHLTTQVLGTFGYVDPEYFQSSQFTEKSDVYSFGLVLAELLTGQKSIRSTKSEEDKSLAAYFLSAMKANRLFEILDARVVNEGREEEIKAFANLTRRCLNLNGRKRPTMREVARELAEIKALPGDLIIQENYEEIDRINSDISDHLETSSSVTEEFSDGENFSININHLISSK